MSSTEADNRRKIARGSDTRLKLRNAHPNIKPLRPRG